MCSYYLSSLQLRASSFFPAQILHLVHDTVTLSWKRWLILRSVFFQSKLRTFYFNQVHKDAKKHLARDAVDLQIAFLFYKKAFCATIDGMTIKTVPYYHVTKSFTFHRCQPVI